jgi:hypothetical protein
VQATFVATSGGGTPSWVSKLFSPALPEPSAGPVLGAGKLVAQTPVAAAAKKTFAVIEVALETGCAAARVCSDAFDLTELPLAAILEVDFAEVEALADAENYDAILQLLEPLVSSPEYVQHCLLHKYPDTNLSNPNLVRLANLLWLQAFQAERERIGSGSCANAVPPVETLIPASQIVLDIETRGDGVSDGYPFVNFFDLADHLDRPSAERERALKQYKCAHLEDFYLPSSDAPSCGNDGRIPDGPYAGEPCGTIAGGACADIAAGYYPYMWLYGQDYPEDQELHPNGDFSRHHRCAYDLETGGEMTCVRSTFLGAGVNETGVCKICGTPPANADPNDYTMVGCRSESTCPDGTDLWPDGRCWPSLGGLPEWMCEADCEHLYNGNGWCMHDISWRLMAEDLNPIMNEYSDTDYGHPICAERFCEGSGMACAGQGMACRPDEDVCEWECLSDADCQASDPLPAYPQGFVCDPDTFTCRLHFTAKP